MKYKITIGILVLLFQTIYGQKNISITLDDVPNTIRHQKDSFKASLLSKLDSLSIPVAIFINEGLIYKGDSIHKNFELLNNWSKREYITLGNHSFSHLRYSTSDSNSFVQDVLKGECILRKLAKKYDKKLEQFRFPYNDLGKDSVQQVQIAQFLEKNGYKITPFTVESSDWMFNSVYKYYLDKGELEKAKEIGNQYVQKTLEYIDFFDSLSIAKYTRSINQIYLCHDNKLNADFLAALVHQLKKRGYRFISLDEALLDVVYHQPNNYFKKWGISWFYRWENSQKERIRCMKQEPSTKYIEQLFKNIKGENK